MGRRSVPVIACLMLLSSAACIGQSIVINRIALLQTRLIQTSKSVRTAFVVNVDNREYWITAKHIFTGIENAPPGVFTPKTVQTDQVRDDLVFRIRVIASDPDNVFRQGMPVTVLVPAAQPPALARNH